MCFPCSFVEVIFVRFGISFRSSFSFSSIWSSFSHNSVYFQRLCGDMTAWLAQAMEKVTSTISASQEKTVAIAREHLVRKWTTKLCSQRKVASCSLSIKWGDIHLFVSECLLPLITNCFYIPRLLFYFNALLILLYILGCEFSCVNLTPAL